MAVFPSTTAQKHNTTTSSLLTSLHTTSSPPSRLFTQTHLLFSEVISRYLNLPFFAVLRISSPIVLSASFSLPFSSLISSLFSFQAWSQIMGDWYINAGTYLTSIALAEAQGQMTLSKTSSGVTKNVFKYLFSYVFKNSTLGFMGATHSTELYFVFGDIYGMNQEEIALSQQMTRYWTNVSCLLPSLLLLLIFSFLLIFVLLLPLHSYHLNFFRLSSPSSFLPLLFLQFAITGNPNGDDLFTWPLFSPSQQNNTIVLDIPYSTTTNFDSQFTAQWKFTLAGWENDHTATTTQTTKQ
jgi:hypothetical protein